ncbi:MAG: hypothetical protein IPL55_10910 [Saprospiraceae bacterium]|nr:hypothetical protein [Saprospiraceae bacterium]
MEIIGKLVEMEFEKAGKITRGIMALEISFKEKFIKYTFETKHVQWNQKN